MVRARSRTIAEGRGTAGRVHDRHPARRWSVLAGCCRWCRASLADGRVASELTQTLRAENARLKDQVLALAEARTGTMPIALSTISAA